MKPEERFDDIFRSVMERGEEEVPAGLWSAVEARLDIVTARRQRRRRLIATAAGFAAAAAIVGGVFLFRDNRTERPASMADLAAVGQEQITAAEAGTIPEITAIAEVRTIPETTTATAAGMTPETMTVADIAVTEEPESMADLAAVGQETVKKSPAVKESPADFGTRQMTLVPEDMALMEEPDSRPLLAMAVNIHANSGGNLGYNSNTVGRRSADVQNFGRSQIVETESTAFLPPVSIGVGIDFFFNRRLSLGTGIIYNFLGRRYNGTYEYVGALDAESIKGIWNSQHYIGIPLDIRYNFAQTEKMSFYVHAGGAIEKCLVETHSFPYFKKSVTLSNKVAGVQFSAGAGVGMVYSLNDFLGVYINPSLRYYFKESHQPKSIRTVQPFEINCELGLRFTIPGSSTRRD